MTYETTLGQRVLRGAEAELVGSAAWQLIDDIRTLKSTSYRVQFGIALFDLMSWQQQIVMVDRVLTFLLDESGPIQVRTALQDATIAAIYAQLLARLENEIDMQRTSPIAEDDDTMQRQDVSMALREHDPDRDWPDAECCVFETWALAIESLQESVLPDEDWLMEGLALDLPPDKGRALKQVMGISGDYFVDVPPEVCDEQATVSWANIVERMSGVRPNLEPF